MINKIYEFSLDVKNSTYIPKMEFYKNDVDTSKMEITLRNGYEIVDLTGCTIVCKILKSDDTEIQNIVDIVDAEAGLMSIDLSSQALAVLGVNTIQLAIYEGLKRLSIHEFTYTVIDTVIGEEGILSENEYPILTQLIADVQAIENIINTSELTRVTNEETRINNESARETNEANREILKGQMDTLKATLESLKSNLETLETNVNANESTRESNETDRELLKTNLESLKTTLEALETTLNSNETTRGNTFDTKINAIDNKIVDVESRCAVKENLIDNKIVDVEARTVAKENSVDSKISEANTTIANTDVAKTNAETATTNANAKITETEATRQSIINTINNLVAQFNALAPANSTNAEVQLARTDVNGKTYASLQERLLADNKQQNIMYADVSGTYISSDSVDGWVENVVIEGNTYQNPALLSEISSTGTELEDGRFEIPLLCVGKNLIPQLEGWIFGKYIKVSDGLLLDDADSSYNEKYLKVKSSTNYVMSSKYDASKYVYFYDSNKNFLGYSGGSGLTRAFETPSNCCYVRVALLNTSYFNNIVALELQIEEGVVTSYEPYQEHKLTILSDYQLEKVGTVADRIVEIDGVWYIEKNTKTITLNGSENWFVNDKFVNNLYLYSDIIDSTTHGTVHSPICDMFTPVDVLTVDAEGIKVYGTALYALRFNIAKTKVRTANEFKTWLSVNTPLVKYKLATPQYIPLSDDQQVALRTFANKTNILSLAEIEPTIKGSVPKSTSASISSINEHLVNVDSELEKIKKLEDATTSTVICDSDFVSIQETGNGFLSDIRLEGRTLNQILTNGNFASTIGWIGAGATLSASNNILTCTANGTSSYGLLYKDLQHNVGIRKIFVCAKVKATNGTPSSIYFDIQDVSGSTSGTGTTDKIVSVASPTQSTSYNLYGIIAASNFTQGMRIKLRHKYIDEATANGKVMEVKDVMALDLTALGMTNYTADEVNNMLNGYFEGLASVGDGTDELVVSSVCGSGNLFDGELELGTLNTDGSIGVITDRTVNKNYVRVIGGKAFYLSNSLNYAISRIAVYDKDKRFIQIVTNGTTFPSNAVYCKFCLLGASLTNNVQLEVGTVATSYKSIETDKKEILYLDTADSTWKKPVLRGKWENGVMVFGDVAEKLSDGKYRYRNVTGETKYVGTEAFVLNDSTTYANTIWISIPRNLSKASSKVMCDKFNSVSAKGDYEGIFIDATNIYIGISKTKATDLATAKTWIVANNITIVYELATPMTYECTPIDLASYDSETNFILESGVLSPRSTIKVQNFIGNIINTMKEKISILEDTVYQTNLATFVLGLNVLNQQI